MTCDECMTAAYDEGAHDEKMQEIICREMGGELPDHLCEDAENNTGFCACACDGEGEEDAE